MLIDQVNNVETCSQEYDALERNVLFQWTHGGIQKIGLKKDVALFIDYLVYAFDEESRLITIVKNIENSIYSYDNGIYSKFRWVTDYLIASCQYHNNHGCCNIDSKLLIEQYNRLQKL